MLTIDALKELGCDTQSGLERCMNNEMFYLKLVNMALGDANFDKLRTAIENDKLDEAFECAHALKGMLGNVALTSILEPVQTMTEALRGREAIDYMPYLEQMENALTQIKKLAE